MESYIADDPEFREAFAQLPYNEQVQHLITERFALTLMLSQDRPEAIGDCWAEELSTEGGFESQIASGGDGEPLVTGFSVHTTMDGPSWDVRIYKHPDNPVYGRAITPRNNWKMTVSWNSVKSDQVFHLAALKFQLDEFRRRHSECWFEQFSRKNGEMYPRVIIRSRSLPAIQAAVREFACGPVQALTGLEESWKIDVKGALIVSASFKGVAEGGVTVTHAEGE